MRLLHLIRHAPAIVDRNTSSAEWVLEPDVECSIVGLLPRLGSSTLRRLVSSSQPKASETAGFLAAHLDVPIETRDGLEEHHRNKQDFIDGDDEFRAKLAEFFARPKERVFGQETADEASMRFHKAIRTLMRETEDDELIVAHGTVISLFLAIEGNGDPMEIWTALKSPDHVSFLWPSLKRANV